MACLSMISNIMKESNTLMLMILQIPHSDDGTSLTRRPLGGRVYSCVPFTSATISSQCEKIEKGNLAHIFLNT